MPIDARIILAGNNPGVPLMTPNEQRGEQLKLSDMANVNAMNQLTLQEKQRQMRDQDIMRQSYMDSGGDLPTFMDLMRRRGASPQAAMTVSQGLAQQQEAWAKYDQTRLENEARQTQAIGSAAQSLLDMPDENARAAAWPGARNFAITNGHAKPTDIPEQYPGEQWLAMHRNFAVSALQGMQEVQNKKAKDAEIAAQNAAADRSKMATAGEERKIAAEELASITNPQTSEVDPEQYQAWRAKHPNIMAPATPSAAWAEQFFRGTMSPDKWAAYDADKRMARMTPAEWKARVDSVIAPSGDTAGLNARTAALVQGYVSRRDFKGADAAIKDASDQLGRTETGVRTAKATAPIKVDVHDRETKEKTTTVLEPDSNGGYTVRNVGAGDHVNPGAVTAGGMNSLNVPTANTRGMIEAAPKVQAFTQRIRQLLDANEQQLGPLRGRWTEFTAGKIGLKNQGYAQLKTDLGLLQTALMRMHVGSRGGAQIMEHFANLIGGASQDPDNLRAALGEIESYANEVVASKPNSGNSGGDTGGATPTRRPLTSFGK